MSVDAAADAERGVEPGTRRRRRRRVGSGHGEPRESAFPIALTVLAVLGSALSFGSVHVPALLVLASVLVLGFGFASFTHTVRRGLPLPALVLLALAAYSALQSLPLPSGLVRWLSPATANDWLRAHELVGAPQPRWLSLSLEPAASRLEALKWGVYAITFALVAGLPTHLRLGRFEVRKPAFGAALAFLSAVLVASVTLAHRVLGASQVYGFYRPIGEVTRTSIGPLMNPNNLAGYLNLGVFCGLGLVLGMRSWQLRAIAAVGLAALLGAAIETGSRGGFVTLALGLVAFALAAWSIHRRRSGSGRRALVATVGIALSGCLFAALAVGPNFASHFSDRSLDKLAMASWVLPVIRDHLWVGVGRGAFESAFQQYRIGESNLIYSHPENFVVQWIAEWGIVVGVLALVACLVMFRPKRLGVFDSLPALGVSVGVAAVLVQNLVDLGLEVPAVSIIVTMVLASCWSSTPSKRTAWTGRSVAWVALGGILALTAVVASEPETLGEARRRLGASLDSIGEGGPALATFRDDLRAAVLKHPADPYFPRLGAMVALRTGDENALSWLNRALELGLMSGRTHYLLAQALAMHGHREQALLELRFAATYDPDLDARISKRALSLTRNPEALKRAAPGGLSGRKLLAAMARAFKAPAETPQRIVLLRAALERDPTALRSYTDLAGELLNAATAAPPLPPCDQARDACLSEVRSLAQSAARIAPESSAGAELLARVALATNDPAAAVQILEQPCATATVRRGCMLLRLRAALGAKKGAVASEMARELTRQSCVGAEECGRLAQDVGNLFASAGSHEEALSYFEMAAREDPTDERWLRVADAAAQVGHYGLALSALQRLEHRLGGDARLRKRIDAIKAAMVRQTSESSVRK